MNSIQRLANIIATAVAETHSKIGMAEKGIISGDRVVAESGTYNYEACCPINLYSGKQVWVQVTESGNAIIIGE